MNHIKLTMKNELKKLYKLLNNDNSYIKDINDKNNYNWARANELLKRKIVEAGKVEELKVQEIKAQEYEVLQKNKKTNPPSIYYDNYVSSYKKFYKNDDYIKDPFSKNNANWARMDQSINFKIRDQNKKT